PVLYAEPIKGQKLPPKLASTNWVYMRPKKDDFKATVPKLIEIIEVDLGWIRHHTRLLQRAMEWFQKQRNKSFLLQGSDLEEGERWVAESTAQSGRNVTPLQAEYISASRKTAVQRQRNLTIGIGAALVVSIFLGIYAFAQRAVAIENEGRAVSSQATAVSNERARATQQAIAEENKKQADENARIAKAQRSASEASIYQSKAGELDVSTLLAVDAYQQLPGLPYAEDILRHNIGLLAIPVKQMNTGAAISKIQVSSDRTKFVTSDNGGKACVWSTQDGALAFCTKQDGALYDSVFSRDGKILATGSGNGVVTLWNANTGKHEKSFQFDGIIWDLSMHPNGHWLGVGRSNGVSLIDIEKMKIDWTYTLSSDAHKIDFDSSGQYMAFGLADGNVSIWNIMKNRTIAGPRHNSEVFDLSFSPDGKWVVSAGADSAARAIKLGEGNRQKYSITHGDWVEYTAFGPDPSWFATASDDGYVRVIDTATGQERMRMAHDNFVTVARISSDGQWIASTGYDHTARIWDAYSGNEVVQIPVEGVGSALTFNPDATRLAVGDSSGNVTLWDISRLGARKGVVSFSGILSEAHFSPNGEWLVADTDDKKVWMIQSNQLGEKEDNRQLFVSVKGFTYNVAVSKDSKWVAVVEYDSNIADYNRVILTSVDKTKKFVLSHDTEVLDAVTFTPDSKQVITADENGLVNIWDVTNGKKIASLKMDGVILSLAVSPNGKYLVAGIEQGNRSLVWDLTTLTQIKTLEQVGSITMTQFSADGKLLATGSSEATVYLWNAEDDSFTRTSSDFSTGAGVSAMEFNPAGDLLAVGDSSGYLYLFDIALGQEAARLRHVNKVSSVSFSLDGKRIAAASQREIHMWDVSAIPFLTRGQLVETACSRLIRNFTKSKWKLLFFDEKYRLICPNLPAGEN
ncbi:MAG: hypothetical protein PHQ36_07290, partial [Anaerolineales bacterium]|nr:hypothetical protein [Anaerolineales bacterium]